MIDTEILQDYAGEARELLDEMDSSLIRLEKEGATPELLNTVFRTVHCIKGSAEYIGLERSSTLTHGVENLLDRLREGVMELNQPIMDFLFRAKDLIQSLIAEVSVEKQERTTISEIMAELDALLGRETQAENVEHASAPSVMEDPIEESPSELKTAETYTGGEISTSETATEDFGVYGRNEERDSFEPTVIFDDGSALRETLDAFSEDDVLLTESLVTEIPVESLASVDTADLQAEEDDTEPTLEATIPDLLNLSLYLDDLQDGLHPQEVLSSMEGAIDTLVDSMRRMELNEAADVLLNLRAQVEKVDPMEDSVSIQEVDALRETLGRISEHLPHGKVPWSDEEAETPILPEEETAAAPFDETFPEDDLPPEPPPQVAFASDLERIPGLDQAAIAALVSAGYTSVDDLSRMENISPTSVNGLSPAAAQQILRFLGVEAVESQPSATPGSQREKVSLLADVEEDLLKQFEDIFSDQGQNESQALETPAAIPGKRAVDLLEDVSHIGEDADREIIEIFVSYGWEILNKISPLVQTAKETIPDPAALTAAAEHLKAIQSSASYMDYRKPSTFLEEWYEKTLWCARNVATLRRADFDFIPENYLRLQDFLRGLECALNPHVAAITEAAIKASVRVAPVDLQPEGAGPPMPQEKPAEAPTTEFVPAASASSETSTEELLGRVSPPETFAPTPATPAPAVQQAVSPESSDSEASQTVVTQEAGESAVVRTMRVDAGKVDILLNQVGELVVNRSYVEQLAIELKGFHRSLLGMSGLSKKELQALRDLSLKVNEASVSLGRVATDLQEGVMKLRMLPIGQLFNRMPRLIRDLSRRVGKRVSLEMHGGDTEVDKRVIEQIYNPLVHLIRNAVDHGIENKDVRSRAGKREEGVIILNAYSQGNQVVVDVEDDGRGVDTEAVIRKAVEHNLLDPADVKNLTPQDIYNILFLPGFSTSERITRTSGRGVGMDVVRRDVEKINGHVEVDSWEDSGTRISIKIPLTLAIIQTLLIRSGRHVFAVPLTSVREIIQVAPRELTTIEGFEVIKFRDETIPVLRMNLIFRLKQSRSPAQERFLVLASAGAKSVGFLVEELIGEQDVVIKPLAEHVCESRGLAGSTILGDGTIALVLDVMEVIEDVITRQRQLAQSAPRFFPSERPPEHRAGAES